MHGKSNKWSVKAQKEKKTKVDDAKVKYVFTSVRAAKS